MTDTRPLLLSFGTLELVDPAADGSSPGRIAAAGKPLALLLFCTAEGRRDFSRDALASLLWGDAEPVRARQSLRQALWRVRQLLGAAVRFTESPVFRFAADIQSDRAHFLDAIQSGDFRAALRWYRGPFLAAVSFPGGDEFDEWAAHERRRLEDALLRTADPYVEALTSQGSANEARDVAEQLLAVAPDSSETYRIALEALLDIGDQQAARRVADLLAVRSATSATAVSARLLALVERARAVPVATTPTVPSPVTLDLVGREATFSAVMQAWSESRGGHSRCVCIMGSAGIGKSRLLNALATRVETKRAIVARVRARVGERHVPFALAASLARELAALPGAAGVGVDSVREIVALDPALGERFNVAPAETSPADVVRRRALALLDLLTAITEEEPLALFLDDLHWADPASVQLLTIVFGRIGELPLLVVGAARDASANVFDERSLVALTLSPLSTDDLVDAIRSSGSWPDSVDATHFIGTLAAKSEGVPLNVVERLASLHEQGILTLEQGTWSATDWRQALETMAVASPLDQRLANCTPGERAAINLLATAGTRLRRATISKAIALRPAAHGTAGDLASDDIYLALETRGLLVPAGDAVALSHDRIGERALALMSDEERRACELALARALYADRTDCGTAVRHFVAAHADTEAAAALATYITQSRAIGDRRSAEAVLGDLAGRSLSATRARSIENALPLSVRVPWHSARVAVVSGLLIASALGVLVWSAMMAPNLHVVQLPVTVADAIGFGADAVRLVPAALVSVPSDRRGLRPGYVWVRALEANTELLTSDSVPIIDGIASFGGLRVRSKGDSVVLGFEAPGYGSARLSVPVVHDEAGTITIRSSLRVLGAVFGARRLNGPKVRLDVSPGELITGAVQVEYDAEWAAASVWLSMTPTWGDPRAVGRDLMPATTPARRDVRDLPINVVAPKEPGRYWIAMVLAAEPSGGFALSGTNWTLQQPVWNDGNDIAALPDSSFEGANQRGYTSVRQAWPANWANHGCPADRSGRGSARVKYCDVQVAMAAIEVIVSARGAEARDE